MSDYEQPVEKFDFKDKKTGLVVFGILQIIFGGIFAFIALALIASNSLKAGMDASQLIPAILFYLLIAAWFISMGIGSIRAKRWARALLLVSSWCWLISGLSGLIFMFLIMPDTYGQMAKAGKIPQEMAQNLKYFTNAFMIFFYLIIPGVLILFYRSKNVKATCEFRDTQVCWTDKCPLPVLAVSLIFAIWAVSMLSMGLYGQVIPFFGFILTGMGAAGVTLVAMLLFAYVAWGTYRLSIKAWWSSVLIIVAGALSTGITFSRVSMWDLYAKMNASEQQIEIMKLYGMPKTSTIILFSCLTAVGFLGYLLYTRRYFKADRINSI